MPGLTQHVVELCDVIEDDKATEAKLHHHTLELQQTIARLTKSSSELSGRITHLEGQLAERREEVEAGDSMSALLGQTLEKEVKEKAALGVQLTELKETLQLSIQTEQAEKLELKQELGRVISGLETDLGERQKELVATEGERARLDELYEIEKKHHEGAKALLGIQESQLTQTHATLDRTSSELTATRDELASLSAELQACRDELKVLEARLQQGHDEMTEAEKEMRAKDRHLAEAATVIEKYQTRQSLQQARKESGQSYLHSKLRMLSQTVFVLQARLVQVEQSYDAEQYKALSGQYDELKKEAAERTFSFCLLFLSTSNKHHEIKIN